tara:strand:+ start:92 stop:766 length:675 start_codon:yes stop_codon:yes gene_type:complete
MKLLFKSLFRRIGLDVRKYPRSKYEYLLNYKRYDQKTVELLGLPFKIADVTSFYYSHREIFIDRIYEFKSNKKEPKIFKILRDNIELRNFKNVSLINKAISSKKESVKLFSEGVDGERMHKIDSLNYHQVEALPLYDLIDDEIDFLKIDIEGAETDVLSNSSKINFVKEILIEYHSFVDDRQKLDILLKFLKDNGFRFYIQTIFCSPRPLILTKSQLGMDGSSA